MNPAFITSPILRPNKGSLRKAPVITMSKALDNKALVRSLRKARANHEAERREVSLKPFEYGVDFITLPKTYADTGLRGYVNRKKKVALDSVKKALLYNSKEAPKKVPGEKINKTIAHIYSGDVLDEIADIPSKFGSYELSGVGKPVTTFFGDRYNLEYDQRRKRLAAMGRVLARYFMPSKQIERFDNLKNDDLETLRQIKKNSFNPNIEIYTDKINRFVNRDKNIGNLDKSYDKSFGDPRLKDFRKKIESDYQRNYNPLADKLNKIFSDPDAKEIILPSKEPKRRILKRGRIEEYRISSPKAAKKMVDIMKKYGERKGFGGSSKPPVNSENFGRGGRGGNPFIPLGFIDPRKLKQIQGFKVRTRNNPPVLS